MHDESWKDVPTYRELMTDENWKEVHETIAMIISNGNESSYGYVTYDYYVKYCYMPGTGFSFSNKYVYYNGTRRSIDEVHSEESYFQQSTMQNFSELSLIEIIALKDIYEFMIGEFP